MSARSWRPRTAVAGRGDVDVAMGWSCTKAGSPLPFGPGEHVDEVPAGIPEDHRAIPPGLGGGWQDPADIHGGDPAVLRVDVPGREVEDDVVPVAGPRRELFPVFGEAAPGEAD